jgi:tetratricopeptide (TPR) repeat protein
MAVNINKNLALFLITACIMAVACAPPTDPNFYREKAVAIGRDEPRRAIDLYRKAAELETDKRLQALDRFAAGILLTQELSDHEGALKEFQAAAGLNPSWDRPYYEMYSTCLALGRTDEARTNLAKCLFVFKGTQQEYDDLKKRLDELN